MMVKRIESDVVLVLVVAVLAAFVFVAGMVIGKGMQ